MKRKALRGDGFSQRLAFTYYGVQDRQAVNQQTGSFAWPLSPAANQRIRKVSLHLNRFIGNIQEKLNGSDA